MYEVRITHSACPTLKGRTLLGFPNLPRINTGERYMHPIDGTLYSYKAISASRHAYVPFDVPTYRSYRIPQRVWADSGRQPKPRRTTRSRLKRTIMPIPVRYRSMKEAMQEAPSPGDGPFQPKRTVQGDLEGTHGYTPDGLRIASAGIQE